MSNTEREDLRGMVFRAWEDKVSAEKLLEELQHLRKQTTLKEVKEAYRDLNNIFSSPFWLSLCDPSGKPSK